MEVTYYPLMNFNREVDTPLWYKVPSIISYELTLIFMRASLVRLDGSMPCSIYVVMGNIQEDGETSLKAITVDFLPSLLGIFKVSWMKE